MLQQADEGTKVYQLVKEKVLKTDEQGNQHTEEITNKVLIEDYFSLDKYARPDILFRITQDVNEWMSRIRG